MDIDFIQAELATKHPRYRVRYLKAWSAALEVLRLRYPGCPDDELAYLFVNGFDRRPQCANPLCDKPPSWFGNKYGATCSRACDIATRSETYRANNAARLSDLSRAETTKAKRRETLIERYGNLTTDRHISRKPEHHEHLNKKGRETLRANHGVDNPGQIPGHSERAKATLQTRYGVSHPSQIDGRDFAIRRVRRIQALLGDKIMIFRVIAPDDAAGEANFRYHLQCECGAEAVLPSETLKFRVRRFGSPCADCAGIETGSSFAEKEIAALVEQCGYQPVRNDRTLIRPYELDIVIPERKIAIEYCGIYWHSEIAGKSRTYHADKFAACEAAGYRLITIFEDEWINRRDIVTSMLRNTLGLSVSIPARKTVVEKISSKIGNKFVEENHVQGKGRANLYYGLYHENDLVSVMSFSKSEISRRSIGWDINRFCSKLGTNVQGAAGKLFSAFIGDEQPEQVVSYADLRYGTGAVYGKIGFAFDGRTTPNYWYFQSGKMQRRHRYGLRKRSDEPKDKTEWELRREQGYNRIWDCGHNRWLYRRPTP